MSPTIELSEETMAALDAHRMEGESYDDLVRELVDIYEQQETFTREGYVE